MLSVSFVEYGIAYYPKGMEGWRCYRIEYGGHAEACITEGYVWLPRTLDASTLEDLMEFTQFQEEKFNAWKQIQSATQSNTEQPMHLQDGEEDL